MTVETAVVLFVNTGFALVFSWVFFLYALVQIKKKNNALANKYAALRKDRDSAAEASLAVVDAEMQGLVSDMEVLAGSVDDLSDLADEQKVNFQQLNELSEQCGDDRRIKELRQKIATFSAKLTASENLVTNLKTQASNYQYRISALEEKLDKAGFYSQRVVALEDQARKLRTYNQQLQAHSGVAGDAVSEPPHYKVENKRLRSKLSEYIEKQKASDILLLKMKRKLDVLNRLVEQTRAALEDSQNRSVVDLDGAAVEELRKELQRVRHEKEFLETQYVEMRQAVESVAEVSEELDRAKKECAMLEQSYLDLCRELDARDSAKHSDDDLTQLYAPEVVREG